jgi:hypothetical protein
MRANPLPLLTSLLVLGLIGCEEPTPPSTETADTADTPADTSFTIPWYPQIRDTLRLVIHDSATWSSFVKERSSHDSVPQFLRTDFDQQSVVVAAMGARPSLGYRICVDSVRTRPAAGTTVYLTRMETPGGPAAMSYPTHLVRTRMRMGS